ncbi:MAG: hypothetical protein ACKVXR_12960 [Planctomycetota bacterium]
MTPALALALLLLAPLAQDRRAPAVHDVAALRAEGPAALERLCTKYDELGAGVEKDALERAIDAVAAQRYATVSRLYWHTDLDLARAAAQATGRPILSLRMLGRLDQDLSCANSRFFRVVLYADPEISSFLRENFVLHWSSERPVPKVTIDFGDGRRIETTIAGNSAHYVLDSGGRPLDVLPGLYSPVAFRRELEAALPLARWSPRLAEGDRIEAVRAYHMDRIRAAVTLWSQSGPPQPVPLAVRPGSVQAGARAVTKSVAEAPAVFGLAPMSSANLVFVRRPAEARLSDASRALVARLAPVDWSREPRPLEGEALERAISTLEALVAADTERNELERRRSIHDWFAMFAVLPDLEWLNELVYRELFLTPREDPWLGLGNPGMITGLPRDGVVE